MKHLVAPLLLAVVAAGCVGGAPQAEEARDAFVENNVSSYAYEGETEYSFGAPGGPARTTTVDANATVNRSGGSLAAELDSLTEGAGERAESETVTYLVNGTVYSNSVRGGNSTGWVAFRGEGEVESTWDARDELAVYEDILRNASVEGNGTETVDGAEANRVEVELGEDRSELLTSKFRDDASFFQESETEAFGTTVWITDDGSLLRAETDAALSLSNQETRTGETDIDVEVRFVDSFRYDDVPAVELPAEAENATVAG